MTQIKKVAIYARVSTTEQNVENQIRVLKEFAERMNWEYDVFIEKESTRKTRPVQWELYNKLLRKEYDALLVYKLDRWGRSVQELVRHFTAFQERGVRFISLQENIDFGTPEGRLMFHLIAAFAEFEREIIRERTILGLQRARAQGKHLGRPPKHKRRALIKTRKGGM